MASTLDSYYSWTLPSPRVLSSLQEDDDDNDRISDNASDYSSDADHDSDNNADDSYSDGRQSDTDSDDSDSDVDLNDENDEPVQIARKLLFDCWKQDHSPAMGNLYDGGLGTYFVLMEYAQRRAVRRRMRRKRRRRKHRKDGMQTPKGQKQGGFATPSPKGSATPRSASRSSSKSFFNAPSTKNRTSIYRSKQYLQQACDAAEKACQSYQQTMSAVTTSYMHQKQNNISIFQSEWVGARALYGICLYHLEQERDEPHPQQSKVQKLLSHSSVKPTPD
eukprot:CAMPEP_0113646860 /NCGR_PEP_ID=MMETSP0017_2-20120614/24773_1 /TAXON_ID=2856 /ORGANISM="Cylindrotheca closterium" /LENGTH=276 /DNA_ID=CAMNT_0000558819 /DNA_START=194 /DNA_END=1021 /DNA_ORIENTATION=+ /assembly_acc=CAM_ASM_000147